MKLLSPSWFAPDAVTLARKLLGCEIRYNHYSGMIVETEAYRDDPASHGHKITPRSRIMLETFGVIYVYFIYGNYFCLNVTTNKNTVGAVLIRAVEPLSGIAEMQTNRNMKNIRNLTSGPGKLCQAFGITKDLNGTKVNAHISIRKYRRIPSDQIVASPRIGIKKATKLPWRFYIRGNEFVSRNGASSFIPKKRNHK